MHDFFVDRLVHAGSLEGLLRRVSAKAAEGGGGIHGVRQSEVRGGNAVNLAHALAVLGLRVLLLTHTDPGNEALLRRTFDGLDVDLKVKPLKAGLTVALEGRTNVMLGDAGGAAAFGPDMLSRGDWDALRASKVVCSVNWAANRHGTELLKALRRKLGRSATIFVDPADFRDRAAEFGKLLGLIAKDHIVDWLSMNEREGVAAAELLQLNPRNLRETCRGVARELGIAFDLHTGSRAYSSGGDSVTVVPVARTRPRRLTGAGDVWDAAAIYGRMKGMAEVDRLNFANTAARLYIEGETQDPPSLEYVLSSLR